MEDTRQVGQEMHAGQTNACRKDRQMHTENLIVYKCIFSNRILKRLQVFWPIYYVVWCAAIGSQLWQSKHIAKEYTLMERRDLSYSGLVRLISILQYCKDWSVLVMVCQYCSVLFIIA